MGEAHPGKATRGGGIGAPVIARVWLAWTTPGNADAYEAFLTREVFTALRAREIPGLLGCGLLRRRCGDEVEFMTVLRFSSLDAVRAMAGDRYERAVVAEKDRALLTRFDEHVAHYEIRAEWRSTG
jgi:antibiotic biosynthesis monooxygenase (ABM) superfamily enzyme